MKFIVTIFTFVLISSCALHTPELRGGESFKIIEKTGETVKMEAKANVYNGNWFGVKVKPSNMDLFVDGKMIGTVRLDKKVKLKRKSESELVAPLTLTLAEGSIANLMKMAFKGDVQVKLKGKVKAGVFIFSKKMDFEQTKTMNLSSLMK